MKRPIIHFILSSFLCVFFLLRIFRSLGLGTQLRQIELTTTTSRLNSINFILKIDQNNVLKLVYVVLPVAYVAFHIISMKKIKRRTKLKHSQHTSSVLFSKSTYFLTLSCIRQQSNVHKIEKTLSR